MTHVYRRPHIKPRMPLIIMGAAGAAAYTWGDYEAQLQFDASKWGTVSIYFEAILKKTGTDPAKARLYNVTDGVAVTDGEIQTNNTTFTRVRSSALTLSGAKEYKAQGGYASGDICTIQAARLIIEM